MNLFDRNKPPVPPPAATANKYTVGNVENLLDEIGLMRLRVKGARMKLLVSAVAWETQKYLDRNFTPGPPPGRVVAELQEQLTMVKNVVTTYIAIQNDPDAYAAKGDVGELLGKGRESLRTYLKATTADSVPDITGYVVDTKVLSTHFN